MNFDNDLQEPAPQEREISLGTATILGIFFVLALICAGFFGFGYTMGRKSAVTPPAAAEAKTDAKPDTFSNFKTAPQASTSDAGTADSTADPQASAATPPPFSTPKPVSTTKPVNAAPDEEAAQPSPAAAFPMPAVATDGQFLVQVSAATRQDDATNLVAALKRKGYAANIRQEADSRFHVLVGPFATKADAEIMRKRLDADGYKGPFIK